MKATKMPSGRWRARYVDHYEVVDGKRKIVLGSVTADTEKDAIRAALELEGSGRDRTLTIAECIKQYISIKESVLSPSTVRSYKSLQDGAYTDIARLSPYEADTATLQLWVGKYASDHSPKAVRNAYALLTASCGLFGLYGIFVLRPSRSSYRHTLNSPCSRRYAGMFSIFVIRQYSFH